MISGTYARLFLIKPLRCERNKDAPAKSAAWSSSPVVTLTVVMSASAAAAAAVPGACARVTTAPRVTSRAQSTVAHIASCGGRWDCAALTAPAFLRYLRCTTHEHQQLYSVKQWYFRKGALPGSRRGAARIAAAGLCPARWGLAAQATAFNTAGSTQKYLLMNLFV